MTRIRAIAALIMASVAICSILLLPTAWLASLAAIVFLWSLWEWMKLSWVEDTLVRTALLALNLLLMVLLVWVSANSLVLFQIATLIGVGWWMLALLWLRFFGFCADPDQPVSKMLKLTAGTLAVIPAWSALILLHSSNKSSSAFPESMHAHLWLLIAQAMVWAADSGAYFAGRIFGKHKLAPRISPNKTVEGLLGGIFTGLVTVAGFGLLNGVTLLQLPALLLVAFVAILASIIGDLFESLLKRHASVKDSGSMIPGHGGVLDRIDSTLAALPVFALGKDIFGF
ncbi:MAG TPA: phosphatidate cytidylyltransferase [Xylella taiwanensis]